MQKISKILTTYIIKKGIVKETERDIYEYGFLIFTECGLFIFCCLVITILFQKYIEGLIFFCIFAPLRSYAGGLHLKKFWFCFILSCLTYFGTLYLAENILVPVEEVFIIILFLLVTTYHLYPIDDSNREVDEEENTYFKNKMLKYIYLDIMFITLCLFLKKNEWMNVIMITFLVIVVTMLIGKFRSKRKKYINLVK